MPAVEGSTIPESISARPEIVIAGGWLVDGTGGPRVRADVGVRGDRIVAIGPDLAQMQDARRLDATGCIVSPGFVDIHSHSDLTVVLDPTARSATAQGVTTVVVGNCGHGPAPIDHAERHADNIYGWDPSARITWSGIGGYLDAVDAARPGVNVATLVPHGALRLVAMVDPGAIATREERAAMRRSLEESLEAGAIGLSTGLEYPTEGSADVEELVGLCEPVARLGRLYATHTRNKDVLAVEAVDEALTTAARAGVRLQVSHLVPRPGAPAEALARSMARIDAAADAGLDVAFDVHTRLFGFTNLCVALPRWVIDGGPDAIRAVLRDRRDELAGHRSIIDSFGLEGYDRMFITDAVHTPGVAGRSVAELAAERGIPERQLIYDVLAAHADRIDQPMAVGWSYTVDQIAQAAAHPRCSPSSDATTLGPDGPLRDRVFHGAYSWAAWVLSTLVRERGALTLEGAVRRMTSLPAERAGLVDRGVVRLGGYADLAVFDADMVRSTATFEEPNRLAVGVRHLVVNGVVATQDGQATGSRGGRALRA